MKKPSRRAGRHPLADAPVMNVLQLGGIETSVLDNGPGRGTRIAWINTGGGLRYKVVIDRGLDIVDAEFLGQSLTFHSLVGVTAPSFAYNRGIDWLRSFPGGLVTSCGPCNMGATCTDEGEELGLHGTHSNTAAVVESIVNPDFKREVHEMSITGIVRTARMFNPNVELRRTVRSPLGEPAIEIFDHFTNLGNQPVPHAWLLHINFGYPLIEPNVSTYCYKGRVLPRQDSIAWFSRKDSRRAVVPQESHRGTGEACAYIDPAADRSGLVTAGVVNEKRGFGVKIEFNLHQFPRMANWQHWGPAGSYVGALEPMNGGVEGRATDRKRGWLDHLKPEETRDYWCRITAVSDPKELKALLKMNG